MRQDKSLLPTVKIYFPALKKPSPLISILVCGRGLQTHPGLLLKSEKPPIEMRAKPQIDCVVNFFLVEAETRRRWDIFQAEVTLY